MKSKSVTFFGFAALVFAVASTGPQNSAQADDNATQTAAAVKQILTTNCIKCHGGASVSPTAHKGGVDYILDVQKLIANGKVKPGDPANSRLYQRLINDPSLTDVDGPMPPDGANPRPSASDIDTVRQWIANGAAAF